MFFNRFRTYDHGDTYCVKADANVWKSYDTKDAAELDVSKVLQWYKQQCLVEVESYYDNEP